MPLELADHVQRQGQEPIIAVMSKRIPNVCIRQIGRPVGIEPDCERAGLLPEKNMQPLHRTSRATLHLNRHEVSPRLNDVIHLRRRIPTFTHPELCRRLLVILTGEQEVLADELLADRTVIRQQRIPLRQEVGQFESKHASDKTDV